MDWKTELEEFRRERAAVGEAEDRGDTSLSEAFRTKWFGRYPNFDRRPRASLCTCFDKLDWFLSTRESRG